MRYKKVYKHKAGYYKDTPLYYLVEDKYLLYKKAGKELSKEKLKDYKTPAELYISYEDIEKSTEELFGRLSDKIKDSKNLSKEKQVELIQEIVENLFANLDDDSMSFSKKLVKEISTEIISSAKIAKQLLKYANSNDELILHSTKVFFLSLMYSYYTGKTEDKMTKLSLVGLFHAVGKTKIPKKIINSRFLSENETKLYRKYPEYSYNILRKSKDDDIKEVAVYAYEHKETENKTGFPNGIAIKDELKEIIGIIDTYEQLTNKEGLSLYDALEIIKKDVNEGKYNHDVFSNFVKSIGETHI